MIFTAFYLVSFLSVPKVISSVALYEVLAACPSCLLVEHADIPVILNTALPLSFYINGSYKVVFAAKLELY